MRKVLYVLKIPIILIGLIFLVLFGNHLISKDKFLEFSNEPQTFTEFRQHIELKGKYLYVNFWHSGCAPCIQDFKNFESFNTSLSKEIKDNVEFVYINVDRNTPGESERGKYFINKYHVDANHYFISRVKFHRWWAELNPNSTMHAAFSIYFLIDPEGNVAVRNGPKLGDALKSLLMEETIKNL